MLYMKTGISNFMKPCENIRNDRYTRISVYHIHQSEKHEAVKRLFPAVKKITDFTTTYFEIAKQTEFINGQDERATPAVDKYRLFRFVADKAVKPQSA